MIVRIVRIVRIVPIVPVVSKKNVQTRTIIWKRYPDDRKRPGRFKIYTIVPIVWIELNSIQAIEVVSVGPGRLRSSGWRFQMIVPVVGTFFFETTGTIRTIIWKPGFRNLVSESLSFAFQGREE